MKKLIPLSILLICFCISGVVAFQLRVMDVTFLHLWAIASLPVWVNLLWDPMGRLLLWVRELFFEKLEEETFE